MRQLEFVTVDVFTSRPLEGNPLAVVLDASGLRDAEMQAIAREFHLSETTFVLPRDPATEKTRGVRTRIFTPREELPFAGHPTLGTAAVLRERGAGDEVPLDLNVGQVMVRFSTHDGRPFGEMTQPEPTFGSVHPRPLVAEAIGVRPEDLDPALPVETVSTGNPFAIVPFLQRSTLEAWSPDPPRMARYLAGTDARFFYALCRETVAPGPTVHARMVFYGGDDPATGSAAGPAGAWMVRHGLAPPGSLIEVEQGTEVHRPSRLFVRVDRRGEALTNVRVGGFVVRVMDGTLRLP